MNIQESNKLIAEFMHPEMVGFDKDNNDGIEIGDDMLAKMSIVMEQYDLLKYHESWDWLMPVFDKIVRMKSPSMTYEISGASCRIEENTFDGAGVLVVTNSEDDDTLGACYVAIVKFIKWYNKNNPES